MPKSLTPKALVKERSPKKVSEARIAGGPAECGLHAQRAVNATRLRQARLSSVPDHPESGRDTPERHNEGLAEAEVRVSKQAVRVCRSSP
jgi:hypothetical protein